MDIGTEISGNIGIALRSSGNISSDFFRFHLIERTGSRWIVEVGGERNENVCLICLSSFLNTETVISDEFRAMLRSSGKISPGFFRFHLID